MKKHEQISNDSDFEGFTSIRLRLTWLANNGPDFVFEESQISQTTCSIYEANIFKQCKRSNKTIKYAQHERTPIRVLNWTTTRLE